MKIKRTVTEKKEVEVEIEIPFYAKDGNSFYKVFDKDKSVDVYVSDASASLHCYETFNNVTKALESTPCTEQEFNEAFSKALYIISKNVDLWVTCSPLPQPETTGQYDPLEGVVFPTDNSIDVDTPINLGEQLHRDLNPTNIHC